MPQLYNWFKIDINLNNDKIWIEYMKCLYVTSILFYLYYNNIIFIQFLILKKEIISGIFNFS